MKNVKYAVFQNDFLYDVFDSFKEAEDFIDNLSSSIQESYYWHVKKVLRK